MGEGYEQPQTDYYLESNGRKPMNSSQQKYALNRIEQIATAHRQTIESDCKKSLLTTLSDRDKVKLIRAKKAVFVKPPEPEDSRYYSSPSLVSCYTYTEEDRISRNNSAAQALKEERLETLKQAVLKLQDGVVLDLAEVSPEVLQNFESTTF